MKPYIYYSFYYLYYYHYNNQDIVFILPSFRAQILHPLSLSACQFVSPGPACCGGQCGATDLPGRHSQDWPAPIGGAAAAASSVSIYHHRYNPDLKWRKKEITLWHNWELKQSDTDSVSSPQSSIFIGFPPDETFATGSARLIDAAISFIRLSWKLNAFQ